MLVGPGEAVLHHLKVYVGTGRKHRPDRSEKTSVLVLLRPFDLYDLADDKYGEMLARGVAERLTLLQSVDLAQPNPVLHACRAMLGENIPIEHFWRITLTSRGLNTYRPIRVTDLADELFALQDYGSYEIYFSLA